MSSMNLFIFSHGAKDVGDEHQGQDENQCPLHDLGRRPLILVDVFQRLEVAGATGGLENKMLSSVWFRLFGVIALR